MLQSRTTATIGLGMVTGLRKRAGKPTASQVEEHAQEASSSANGADIRTANIGRLLLLSYRRFERIAMAELKKEGFEDLRLPHFQVLPHVTSEGVKVTAVAALMSLTKQAVSQIANDLEIAGYLTRIADSNDGRAKLLAVTPKGQQLLAVLPAIVFRAEQAVEVIVGKGAFSPLKQNLRKIAEE